MWVLLPARQLLTGIEKSSFFVVLDQILQTSCAEQEIDLPLIVLKDEEEERQRQPPGCGRHHQGVAGQGNISDLNQLTNID